MILHATDLKEFEEALNWLTDPRTTWNLRQKGLVVDSWDRVALTVEIESTEGDDSWIEEFRRFVQSVQ